MRFERATQNDIAELTELRLAYLKVDYGSLQRDAAVSIKEQLPDYFLRHINRDLHIYIAREERIVSCVFLLTIEKPANPMFISGRTGMVLNVYTEPDYRRRGLARELMEMMISDARQMQLDFVELKATEDGYALYQSIGFQESITKYHQMKYVL